MPKVSMIDYTGFGSADPARHAANVLVFAKATRLTMSPGLMTEIAKRPWDEIESELKYIANTIAASQEFVHYTFLIECATRAFTHQFVRTRTGSYAQQTMRVLNVEGWEYGTGKSITDNPLSQEVYDKTMAVIADAYEELISLGAEIEDARGVLPTNIQTNIVAGFNLRTFGDVARKRASTRTQGEYRTILDMMIDEVKKVHPWTELFFSRDFDNAAKELESAISSMDIDRGKKIDLIKLIDLMRTKA